MQNLNANESIKYVGGAKFTIGLVSALAFITSFILGVFDGEIKLKWQKLKNTVFKGNFVEKPSIQIHQEDAIMYIKL